MIGKTPDMDSATMALLVAMVAACVAIGWVAMTVGGW